MNYVLGLGEVGNGAPTRGRISDSRGQRVRAGRLCVTADAFTRAMDAVHDSSDLLESTFLSTRTTATGCVWRAGTARDCHRSRRRSGRCRGAVLAPALSGYGGDMPLAVPSMPPQGLARRRLWPDSGFVRLDVSGRDQILRCVTRCWASLFTERAVAYRMRNGFDHRQVRMAVVVQKMVFPDARVVHRRPGYLRSHGRVRGSSLRAR